MANRYGEWIHDVENFQFAAPEDDKASGGNFVVSGEVFVKLPGANTSYHGSHILYQDVSVPTAADGTSNTFMYAEKFQLPDGEHVLTTVQHSAGGEDSRGLWQINVAADADGVRKGGWITDVTYETLPGGTAVAIETLTIAHEGILLL